jgi:hypothetical protein
MFQNEIMIGASAAIERRVLSSITLGLAQDSGWYVPNWEAQGFLRHGHLVGCDMLVRIAAILCQSAADVPMLAVSRGDAFRFLEY